MNDSGDADEIVFSRVCDIVAETLGVNRGEIQRSSNLVDDLNADSLDLVDVVMSLEKEFGREEDDTPFDAMCMHAYRDFTIANLVRWAKEEPIVIEPSFSGLTDEQASDVEVYAP
jgi:acyl carrier protein